MNGILYMNVGKLEDSILFDKCMSLVSADRLEKVKKYKTTAPARLSLGAGILLRIAMEKCGVVAKLNDIQYGEHGKPYLKDSEFYFSLSHSGEYAICVYGDVQLGADLQKVKTDIPKYTKKILSKEEEIYLNSFVGIEKKKLFYRLWAGKESLIKYDGRGLQIPLQSISLVDCDGLKKELFFENKRLYFREVDLFMPKYTFCICSEKEYEIENITEITANFLTKY